VVLETPPLCHLLPVDIADALEDRATAMGTDALTLATALLRRGLAPHGIWPEPLPRSVAGAVLVFLREGEATESVIAAWLKAGCGWSITDTTLRTTLSRLATAGRIRRVRRGRYALGVDKG
jgi:hypothetical protein